MLPFAFGDQEKPEFCPYGGHGPWATILRMVFPLGSLGAEAPTPERARELADQLRRHIETALSP